MPVGGKHRFKQYVELLNRLGIKVKVVADVDLLDDRCVLKELVCSCGGSWNLIEDDYGKFSSGLSSPRNQVSLDYFIRESKRVVDECDGLYLGEEQVERIRKLLPRETKWSELKRLGTSCLKGEQIKRFERIDGFLRMAGIHIVRVGELECFVRVVEGHGPSWVNDVLDKYPNLENDVYGEAREFVKEWLDWAVNAVCCCGQLLVLFCIDFELTKMALRVALARDSFSY